MNFKLSLFIGLVLVGCTTQMKNEEVSTLNNNLEVINDPHSYAEPTQS